MTTFNGPVQINVTHGTCASDVPDDCVLPRSRGKRRGLTLLKVGGALGAVVIGAATMLRVAELAAIAVAGFLSAVHGFAASIDDWITSTVAWLVSMSTMVCIWVVRLVLGSWMVGRAAELYLLLERALGGGPRRLIVVSKFFGQRRIEVEEQLCLQPDPPPRASSTPKLAGGKSHGLAAINAREAFASKRTSSPI